jgi:outer membrane protein TolC
MSHGLSPRRATLATRLVVLAPLALAACGTLKPDPITSDQHAERAKIDFDTLKKDYQPINGPLTLAEAIARALKYNYDAELTRVEQTLQERQIDLAMAQMLPRLAASAGYSWRSNPNAAESIDVITRKQSLTWSYAEEPDHGSAALQFSWNALDIGVGYFQAKQQGYRALVAVERRRKVIDNIVKGVQEAYWKAAIAQQLLPQLDPLLAQSQKMLDNSRLAVANRLQPRAQGLEYQQGVLEVISQLRHMRTDLNNANVRLATLINVPIGTPMQIADKPPTNLTRPAHIDAEALEITGLNLRPEVREAAYQEKIDRQDVYKEIIKMMPGIGIIGSLNYDSNDLLYRNTWGDFGVRATYNLVSLIEGPQAIRAAKTAVEVSKVRRVALGVAVLTQVNLGIQEYLASLEDLGTANEINRLQQELSRDAAGAAASNAQPESASIRRALAAMASNFELGQALTATFSSLANLYIATGVDLVPADADVTDLDKLIEVVRAAIVPWQKGMMPSPVVTTAAMAQEGQQIASAEQAKQ